jgi:hypothetical protein
MSWRINHYPPLWRKLLLGCATEKGYFTNVKRNCEEGSMIDVIDMMSIAGRPGRKKADDGGNAP